MIVQGIGAGRGMQLIERRSGVVTLVDVAGKLRLDDGVHDFRETIVRLVAQGKSRIVLNMAGCNYVDSAGLGELATAMVRTQRAGGHLVLVSLTDRVRELLQVTRLVDSFTITVDESSAITAAEL